RVVGECGVGVVGLEGLRLLRSASRAREGCRRAPGRPLRPDGTAGFRARRDSATGSLLWGTPPKLVKASLGPVEAGPEGAAMAGFLACGSLSGIWPSRSPSGRVEVGLSAYSCGGSRRFGRRIGRTAFPLHRRRAWWRNVGARVKSRCAVL